MQVAINDTSGKRLATVEVDSVETLRATLERLRAARVIFRSIAYGTIPPYGTIADSDPVAVESLSEADLHRLQPYGPEEGFGSFCELVVSEQRTADA